jgi:hypothetical protein
MHLKQSAFRLIRYSALNYTKTALNCTKVSALLILVHDSVIALTSYYLQFLCQNYDYSGWRKNPL